jgi:hypothetical protein
MVTTWRDRHCIIPIWATRSQRVENPLILEHLGNSGTYRQPLSQAEEDLNWIPTGPRRKLKREEAPQSTLCGGE